MTKVSHTLNPIFDSESKVLILGSMPSVTSREKGKYYAHPSNRFWRVLEVLYEEKIDDWKAFILNHHLALWDVIAECDISSSSDSSIKNVKVNDISGLVAKTKIKHIFILGKKAYELYNKYVFPETKIEGVYLPSPSSANASKSLNELVSIYKVIRDAQ